MASASVMSFKSFTSMRPSPFLSYPCARHVAMVTPLFVAPPRSLGSFTKPPSYERMNFAKGSSLAMCKLFDCVSVFCTSKLVFLFCGIRTFCFYPPPTQTQKASVSIPFIYKASIPRLFECRIFFCGERLSIFAKK